MSQQQSSATNFASDNHPSSSSSLSPGHRQSGRWARDPRTMSLSDSFDSQHVKPTKRSGSYVGHHEAPAAVNHRSSLRSNGPITPRSRDDLSLMSVSNTSDVRYSRENLSTPPQGAGLYPPRNRYNIRLPPLGKQRYY